MTVKARQKLTHTFHIDFVSDIDDMRYTGRFTVQKLSMRDLAALGVRKAQLNGGMHFSSQHPGYGVDESTDNFNNMMAHLEIAVKDAPAWWDLDKISDIDLMQKVYEEVAKFENSFLLRKSAGSQSGGDGEGSGEGELSEADTAGTARQVVGEEVQAALEP